MQAGDHPSVNKPIPGNFFDQYPQFSKQLESLREQNRLLAEELAQICRDTFYSCMIDQQLRDQTDIQYDLIDMMVTVMESLRKAITDVVIESRGRLLRNLIDSTDLSLRDLLATRVQPYVMERSNNRINIPGNPQQQESEDEEETSSEESMDLKETRFTSSQPEQQCLCIPHTIDMRPTTMDVQVVDAPCADDAVMQTKVQLADDPTVDTWEVKDVSYIYNISQRYDHYVIYGDDARRYRYRSSSNSIDHKSDKLKCRSCDEDDTLLRYHRQISDINVSVIQCGNIQCRYYHTNRLSLINDDAWSIIDVCDVDVDHRVDDKCYANDHHMITIDDSRLIFRERYTFKLMQVKIEDMRAGKLTCTPVDLGELSDAKITSAYLDHRGLAVLSHDGRFMLPDLSTARPSLVSDVSRWHHIRRLFDNVTLIVGVSGNIVLISM